MSEKVPRPNNFDPVEFAKSIEDSTPKNSRLLGQTALNSAYSVDLNLGAVERYNYPELHDHFIHILNKRIDQYISEEYDVEKEIREPLAKAPDSIKKMQNEIFSDLIRPEDHFIMRTIRPEKCETRTEVKVFAAVFGEKVPEVYDFTSKITEKGNSEEYIIPDKTIKNFISWYHNRASDESKDIFRELNSYANDYKNYVHIASKYNILPKEFEEKVKLLNDESEDAFSVEYGLLDAINAYRETSDELYKIGGTCEYAGHSFIRNKKINLRLDLCLKNHGKLYPTGLSTFYHELTHAASGDDILFGNNEKARRIFNEALTESICNRIMKIVDLSKYSNIDNEALNNIESFGGRSYKTERKVLEYLSSGGKKNISPAEFYIAYIDENLYDEDFSINNPGPNQQKLIDDLLESFPECKDLTGLGKMIVDKFNELKESSKEDAASHASA
ncbi:hypothetical protein IKF43_01515 [Candidatus Saccharibacteria bacterium]|nr:hypothetical protein [Candidatus Saccharibacteria bacterium]